MLYRQLLSLVQILLAVPDGKFVAPSSRLVAAESILDDKKRQSVFPLQRLEGNSGFQALEQRDRSFARALVATTERRMGQIDKIVATCRERKPPRPKKDDLLVDAALRLGIAQILFMDVPLHAAVKETIDVLRAMPFTKVPESKIKFTNAILRRVSRDGEELLEKHTHPTDNIAPWLLNQWKRDWGTERAAQIAEACMNQSPIHLSVKYPRDDRSEEARDAMLQHVVDEIGGESIVLPHGCIRVGDDIGGMVNKWPLYEEGLWWVQDASASLPGLALYSALQHENVQDMHVVDMCAAPGGKTAQLASLGFGSVTAIEYSSKRTRRLRKNLERLGILDQCSITVADGTEWTIPDETKLADGILLDVPCSATGTGSKRPDVLRRGEEMSDLLETQEKLANHCADNILQPGGILIYATCSTLKQESEDQVQKLLARTSVAKMETIPILPGEIPGFDPAIDENGWLRVLPGSLEDSIGPCDGFFVARLRRVA